MLGKLIKYDMKYMARILPWIYLGGLGASAMISTVILLARRAEMLFAGFFMLGLLFVLTIEAAAICSSVFMMVRVYKNLFSDEGYLTFTLPVKNSAVVSSKIITGAIWTLISYAVIAVMLALPYAALSFSLPGIIDIDVLNLMRDLFETIAESFSEYPAKTTAVIVLYALNAAASLFYTISLYTFCAAATHTTKKGRGFASVGMFLGVSFGLNLLKSIVNSIVNASISEHYYASPEPGYYSNTSFGVFGGIFSTLVGGQLSMQIANLSVNLAVTATVIVLSWCFSVRIVNKKLNLQ